ncbi:SH3 domain-containing protein [Priestia abyssalis]|uniref:SH3 domain-containing protein n=1 Tax=Priestia abyssalis TaxID=1221450 RepID=UPI0009951311|nr:SH3 domain-containing protein [Priestia abyssalis]
MTKKPFIYSIGCSVLMSPLLATPSGAAAAPNEYATVTADVLNVRSYPSTGSNVIGKLSKDQEISILAEQDDWSHITYGNKKGWVSSTYIQKGKAAAKTPANTASTQKTGVNAFVKASNLNVRSAPSTSGNIIASLPNGTKVTVLGEKNGWSQIKTPQNQTGWVTSQYLAKTAPPQTDGAAKPAAPPTAGEKTGTVTASNLNVRSSASTSGTIIASLPKNTKVSVLSTQGSWVQIKLENKKTGWVAAAYLTISQTAVQPNKPAVPSPETGKTGTVNVSSLNLRSMPSTSSQVLSSLPRGTAVAILKVESGWAQVKTSANQIGWVSSPYLTMKEAAGKPDTAKPATPAQSVTLKSNANLRKGPGTSFSVVGSGQAGTTYTLIKEQNDWMNIKLSNGQEAWVAGWLVTKGNTAPTAPTAPPSIPASILKGKRIVIDAGHGGKDSGTVGQKGSLEKTLALNTSKLVVSLLKQAGANVVMTRDDDTFISLSGRVTVSHQHNADAFISIHYNAASPSANGIMSFYYSAEKERQLAKTIQESLIKYTNMNDMGVRFGNFHVIRENKKPAVLLELGFLSNPAEEQVVKSDAFQQNAAKAIYEGIARYFEQL